MSATQGRILVVEDDDAMRQLLVEEIGDAGYAVVAAAEGEEALAQVARHSIDVVVTDLRMPGMRGETLLSELKAREPDIPVVIITAFGSIDSAVETIRAGAYHYVAKPFRMAQLLHALENALRERRLRQELETLRTITPTGGSAIVARSRGMRRVLDVVARAAASNTAVLIEGESGTGKELLARALHQGSTRSHGPFVALNCAAIPESLLESQLFGHKRGTFTDAHEDRQGLLVDAHAGTLFLDEIGDLALALQAKLLRVLQEREVLPLGAPSTAAIPIDVRIVAATNQNLDQAVLEGRFRRDLLYRLNVISVRVPPLRERMDDLAPLVAHLLEKHGRRVDRPGWSVGPEALEALRRYSWPGNVRELENAIERGLVLGRNGAIQLSDLPEAIRRPGDLGPDRDEIGRPMSEVEREHILRTLRSVRGNKAAAARLLGFDRKTLYRKLRAFGLESR